MKIPYYRCKCGETVHASKRISHLKSKHNLDVPTWKGGDEDWFEKLKAQRKLVNEWFGKPFLYSNVDTPTSLRWERVARRHGWE